MSSSEAHYDVLGLSKSCSQDDIRHAYKQKALQFHPDKNSDSNAEGMFKQVAEAYEVLSDPSTREEYDHPPRKSTAATTGGGGGYYSEPSRSYSYGRASDIFESFMDAMYGGGGCNCGDPYCPNRSSYQSRGSNNRRGYASSGYDEEDLLYEILAARAERDAERDRLQQYQFSEWSRAQAKAARGKEDKKERQKADKEEQARLKKEQSERDRLQAKERKAAEKERHAQAYREQKLREQAARDAHREAQIKAANDKKAEKAAAEQKAEEMVVAKRAEELASKRAAEEAAKRALAEKESYERSVKLAEKIKKERADTVTRQEQERAAEKEKAVAEKQAEERAAGKRARELAAQTLSRKALAEKEQARLAKSLKKESAELATRQQAAALEKEKTQHENNTNNKQGETKKLKLLKAKPWAVDLVALLYRFEGKEVSAERISAVVGLQFSDWSEAEVSETCILCVDAGLLSISDRPGMLHCSKTLPRFAENEPPSVAKRVSDPPMKTAPTKIATRPSVCSTPKCRRTATSQDTGDQQWYCEPCFVGWEEEEEAPTATQTPIPRSTQDGAKRSKKKQNPLLEASAPKQRCATRSCANHGTVQDYGDQQWYCEPCFQQWEEELKRPLEGKAKKEKVASRRR